MISCYTTLGALCALALSAGSASMTVLPLLSDTSDSLDTTPIHVVQGRAHRSPLEGQLVSVTGVVTGVGGTKFTLQSPPGAEDEDPATSEAVLVVMAGAGALRPGDAVSVSGRVEEDRPGGRDSNLSVTRLVAKDGARLLSRDQPLPAPVLLGKTGRQPPMDHIDDDSKGSVESPPLHFDPDVDAIDFFESLESMLVRIPRPRAVSATSKYGEIVVICDDGLDNPSLSRDGLLVLADGDTNPERILVDDAWEDLPEVSAGARFDGPMTGVLTYEWGTYRLWLTEPCPSARAGRERDSVPPAPDDGLRIVSYNVENLSPQSKQSRITELGEQIVDVLDSPDLLALQEIQDGSGPDNDGVVSGAATYAALQKAIDAAGGPTYEAFEIAPINGADGGQPGGNIRVAFLVRTDSAIQIAARTGGSATEGTTVKRDSRGAPQLSHNPGRVSPTDPAWQRSRVSLAVELRWHDRTLFVINNHWRSKGSDDPLFGPVQPPIRHSEERRLPQAALVHEFVSELLSHDEQALVIVLGDFNDFDFSAPMQRLQQGGVLTNLLLDLPPLERWTYVYQGNAQALDHLLVSRGLSQGDAELDFRAVHLNAAFPRQASDHDPLVLTLRWPQDE